MQALQQPMCCIASGACTPTLSCLLPPAAACRNLKGVVTDLCRQAAEQTGVSWRALLLDLRNHGKSARVASLHPPHSLSAAAHDVVRVWQQALGGRPPEVLVGHSMGGKTALEVVRQLALPNAPQMGQPKHVWVLDARPTAVHSSSSGGGGGGVDAPTQDVLNVLEAVRSVPLPLASRQALYEHLGARGLSTALQQWLGSSLTPDGQQQGGLVWTFNVEGAAQMFDDYCRLDYSQLLRCGAEVVRDGAAVGGAAHAVDNRSVGQLNGHRWQAWCLC
jgi:pimeloyl-ACP methyl ester carboxylesterase